MPSKPPKREVRKHLATLRRVEREGVIDRPDDFVKAIDSFTRWAEADPDLAAAAGRRFFELELESETRSIRENPKDASNYARRGELRLLLGDKAGAKADYAKAARLFPRGSPQRRRLTQILERLKRPGKGPRP